MDIEKTLAIVQALASGHDPATGEALPADHLCQQPDVIRALLHTVDLVERAARRERGLQRARLTMPSNTGKNWTGEEDRALIQRFRSGASIADMATLHARTTNSITARLEKLGQIKPAAPAPNGQHPRHGYDA